MAESSSSRFAALLGAVSRVAEPVAQVVTRIAFGQAFAITGWGKLHNLDNVVKFFTDLGIPAPAVQAPLIATLEFVGGLLLVVGAGTRVVAALLTCTMLVALATADRESLLEGFTLAKSFADVTPLPFLVALLWLVARGAGALSVDRVLARRAAAK